MGSAATPPPASQGVTAAPTSGRHRPSLAPPGDVDLSVFDILNIFCCHWFLSRTHLLANAISAQKAEDRNIT